MTDPVATLIGQLRFYAEHGIDPDPLEVLAAANEIERLRASSEAQCKCLTGSGANTAEGNPATDTVNTIPPLPPTERTATEYDDFDQFDFGCPNCGGEGFVSSCFEEWACIDPEGGCDECTSPCDWCSQREAKAEGRQ